MDEALLLQDEIGKLVKLRLLQKLLHIQSLVRIQKKNLGQRQPLPQSFHFDTSELIAEGKVPDLGIRIILKVTAQHHLQRTILRSDAASVSIPELQLESLSGVGRFTSVTGLLDDFQIALEKGLSFQSSNNSHQILSQLRDCTLAKKPFTFIIDDPVGVSDVETFGPEDVVREQTINLTEDETEIKHLENLSCPVSILRYKRTWQQNEDLGLLSTYNIPLEQSTDIATLVELISKAKRIVAFTGAGISTESNIAAFRSSEDDHKLTATWKNYDPDDFTYQRILTMPDVQERYCKMKTELMEQFVKATPNPAHHFFALLNQRGQLHSVITQNIDRLHHRANVPPELICELHGTAFTAHCVNPACLQSADRLAIHAQLKSGSIKIPHCSSCGSLVKDDTISFGQALDATALYRARENALTCDLMICIGSSLVVSPANQIPTLALSRNIPLIILNQSPTKFDDFATVRITQPCGQVLAEAAQLLQAL